MRADEPILLQVRRMTPLDRQVILEWLGGRGVIEPRFEVVPERAQPNPITRALTEGSRE